MHVGKIDSNNLVVETLIIKLEKIISNNGTVTEASCQAWCAPRFGADFTYIPESISNNLPNIGMTFDRAKMAFHEGLPLDIEGNECTSWVWNTEHFKFHAPHIHGSAAGKKQILWRESNSRWYARVKGETNGNYFTWNTTSSTWEDTGSATL